MLKAILFDLDGVIVDTEPLHRKAYYQMFDTVKIDVSNDLYTSFTGQSTIDTCKKLCQHFDLDISAEKLVEMKRQYFKSLFFEDESLQLIKGVQQIIEDYYKNGLTLIVASSASMFTINSVLHRFDLDRYFKDKLSGANLKASKPHPEIFLKAASAANAQTNECIVIEDSTNGIKAAHTAGIFCVAYKSENSKNQDYSLANKVISDYEEINFDNLKSDFPNF